MPALPQAPETDTALGLGASTASAPLPTAVDDSAPLVFETDSALTLPPSTASAETFTDPPVSGALAPAETDAAFTLTPLAVGDLPTAAERDLALPLTTLVDDGEFEDAIVEADRVPVYTLKADWNRNGLYDHVLSDLTDLV